MTIFLPTISWNVSYFNTSLHKSDRGQTWGCQKSAIFDSPGLTPSMALCLNFCQDSTPLAIFCVFPFSINHEPVCSSLISAELYLEFWYHGLFLTLKFFAEIKNNAWGHAWGHAWGQA